MSHLNEVMLTGCEHCETVQQHKILFLHSCTYIVNEVSYISRVGQTGSDGVLRLSNHGSLIHPAHPRRLTDDVV